MSANQWCTFRQAWSEYLSEKWSTKPGGGGGGLLKPHLSGGAQNQSSARGVSVSGVDINGSHNSFLNWQPSPSHPQWASAAANAKNEPSSVEPIFQPTGDFYCKQSSFWQKICELFCVVHNLGSHETKECLNKRLTARYWAITSSPVAQKAKLGFKLLLLERLNENLKQKHF